MFRSRLAAEGVPAIVIHERHVGNAWHFSTALGGVRVQVSSDHMETAGAIARRCGAGEFREALESRFGATDEIHCPKCGSRDYRRRRPVPRAALALALSFLTGVIIPPAGWIYICGRCGTKFTRSLAPLTFHRLETMLMAAACSFAVFLAAALCAWSTHTRYWFVAPVIAIVLTGRWLARRTGDVAES